jgi:hypothetical protein
MHLGARQTSTLGGSRKACRIPPRRNKDERKLKEKRREKASLKGRKNGHDD